MRTHPVIERRADPQRARGRLTSPRRSKSCATEHERWDGGGYPDGCCAGERIPLSSRITLVCDAYHAMTSDRPYRRALSETEARAQIRAGAGSQFCPTAAAALLEILDHA